jgi:hypothetical protein
MIRFATFLPNWNSLDSVRRIHSDLEAAALIFFALLVVFEALAHSTEDEVKERSFTKIGLWFFAIAVLAESVAYPYGQRNDTLSGNEIVSLDQKSKDAEGKALNALQISTSAISQAGRAQDASGKASGAASNALTVASGARREADSFEADIVSAKKQAADAVSHLADAEQRLADSTQREASAEAKLSAIKTPRSLVHISELAAALKAYKGTEYTLNVFMDDEAAQFTKDVARALDEAGWVRKQPAGINIGIPALSIDFGHGVEIVPSCIETGVSVHAFTKEPLASLQTLPFTSLPKTIRAALMLTNTLAPHIAPPEERNVAVGVVDPKPAEGVPIRICVGKKP